MTIKELETVKTQSVAMDIDIIVVNYDMNRYSVAIGRHTYTSIHSALSALSIAFLKANK